MSSPRLGNFPKPLHIHGSFLPHDTLEDTLCFSKMSPGFQMLSLSALVSTSRKSETSVRREPQSKMPAQDWLKGKPMGAFS